MFGTDSLGRDVFSRSIHGARISLTIGLIGVLFAFVFGIILGGISGYFDHYPPNVGLEKVLNYFSFSFFLF